MGWYEDLQALERYEIPESVKEWWKGLTTPRPMEGPEPVQTQQQLLESMRGPQLPPPTEIGAPEMGGLMKTYQDFVAAGGKRMTFGDDVSGIETDVRIKKPSQEKQKPPQVQQPQPPTQPAIPQPQPQQQWSQQVQPQLPMTPDQLAIQTQENIRQGPIYSPRYRPGEEPRTARETYNQELELLRQKRAEREGTIREGYPSRGEMLSRGYGAVSSRMSKTQRIIASVLTQDPFYTDKLALAEAEYESKRRELAMDRTLTTIDADYGARISALDKLTGLETKERAAAAADLNDRLKTNPELTKNRQFMKDYAISHLGVSAKQVDTYVDDHYDQKTGNYILVRDPYSEEILQTRNKANVLKEIYPDLSTDIAITAARNATVMLNWATDEIGRLNLQITTEKNPERKAILESRRDRLQATQTSIVQNKDYRKLLALEDIYYSGQYNKMSPPQKLDWGKNYKAAYDATYGPTPEQDPEKIIIARRKEVEDLKAVILENHRRRIAIEKGETPAITNIHDEIIASFPTQHLYAGKKVSEKTQKEYMIQHQMYIDKVMREGEKSLDENEKVYMEHYRNTVERYFPPEVKTALGRLSYREAIAVSQVIGKAQAAGMDYNIYDIANKIANARRSTKPRK